MLKLYEVQTMTFFMNTIFTKTCLEFCDDMKCETSQESLAVLVDSPFSFKTLIILFLICPYCFNNAKNTDSFAFPKY